MSEEDIVYDNAIIEINKISIEIENELKLKIDFKQLEKSKSTLDSADYCFAFLFGFLGAFLSTNKKLEKYLADIHKAASEANGEYDKFQILMGKLLHHKKDNIDTMINRNGTNTNVGFHRLLYGHDIFSLSQDNPFALMIGQKNSKIRGALQALRHLIADTMSKQGLPAPGTSAFDYIKENGKSSNYIIDLVNNLSIESFDNKAMAQEIYSHLFTIRSQDILGGVLAKTLTESYFKSRKINDKLRKAQMIFMVYAINFFAESIIGSTKQNGIPYINIPVGALMIVSFTKMCYVDFKETKQLTENIEELTKKTNKLMEKYETQLKMINFYNSTEEMTEKLEKSDNNMDLLIDFLEGE